MTSQQVIEGKAKARANAELDLKMCANINLRFLLRSSISTYLKAIYLKKLRFTREWYCARSFLSEVQIRSYFTIEEVTLKLKRQKQYGRMKQLEKALSRYSRAAHREVVARLFVLPRELRDMIYDELWALDSCKEKLIDMLVSGDDRNERRRGPWTQRYPGKFDCFLPSLAKQGFGGRQVATEMLKAFGKRDGTDITESSYSDHWSWSAYRVSWKKMHDLITVKMFHSDVTLYELLGNMGLVIVFDCMDKIDGNEGLERIGIPGNFNAELRRCIDALSSLRDQKPRSITFGFEDETIGVPSNTTHLFRSLSGPFHELRQLGFDINVRCQTDGYGRWAWDMSGTYNTHSPHTDNVDKWTLRNWSLNFTRVNEQFEEAHLMGETFVFNPNGPLRGSFRIKKHVWEAMRKELYRAYPEIDNVVKWTKNERGEIWMDCGCVRNKHTCCPYYLCYNHGGWDVIEDGRWNNSCYICKGLVAPAL